MSVPPYLVSASQIPVGHNWREMTFVKERTDQVPFLVFHTLRPCTGIHTAFRDDSGSGMSDVFSKSVLNASATVGDVVDYTMWTRTRSQTESVSYEPASPLGAYFRDIVWPTTLRLLQRNLRMTNFEVTLPGFWVILTNQLVMQAAIHDYENIMNLYDVLEREHTSSPQAEAAFRFLKRMQPWKTEYRTKYRELKSFLESLPQIGYFSYEVTRMMTPFMAPDMPQVHVPVSFDWEDQAGTTPESLLPRLFAGLENYRDHMIVNYDAYLVTLNHIFPQMGTFPSVSPVPQVDLAKWQGRYNSSFHLNTNIGNYEDVSSFGNFILSMDADGAPEGFVTNYEDVKQILSTAEGEADANALAHAKAYRSLGDSSLLSMMSGDIFVYDADLIDAEHCLISLHQWGSAWVPHHTSSTDLTATYLVIEGPHIPENQKHWAQSVGSRLIQEDTDEFFIPRGSKLVLHIDEIFVGLREMQRQLFGTQFMEAALSSKVAIDRSK
jgi:hypothetical protein